MAEDQKKVKLDIGSVEEAGQKLGEGVSKGFKKGVEDAVGGLEGSDLKKKLASTFSFDGIKQSFANAVNQGLAGTEKSKKKQSQMQSILKANAELSGKFTQSIASGAGKSQILSAGLGLAKNHALGMLKNMNPYVAALKVGVALVKQYLKYYQETLKASTKFVTSNSLLTDKGTMQMMQKTGQSASGAQGTMRALDRLGLDFNDLQTGNVTKAQMAMFEELRKAETTRLEEIARVGGPVFEGMQRAAVATASMSQKIRDSVTFAFAKSKGVLNFAQGLQGMAETVGNLVWNGMKIITPIINVIGSILGNVMSVVKIVGDVINSIIETITPIYDTVNDIINVLSDVASEVFSAVGRIVTAVLKPAFKIISTAIKNILAPVQVIIKIVSAIISAIFVALEPIFQYVEMMGDILSSLVPVSNALEQMQPILDVITKSIHLVGAALGWIFSKINQGIKWLWDVISAAINGFINMIGGAFHDLIRGLVKTATLGTVDIGDYGAFDVNKMLGNLASGLDKAIAAVEGDTFNYNYNNTQNNNSSGLANQNLFANQYALVND